MDAWIVESSKRYRPVLWIDTLASKKRWSRPVVRRSTTWRRARSAHATRFLERKIWRWRGGSSGYQDGPNIACPQLSAFGVKTYIRPFGFSARRATERNATGSRTCSITWLVVITSNALGGGDAASVGAWMKAGPRARAEAAAFLAGSTPCTVQPKSRMIRRK